MNIGKKLFLAFGTVLALTVLLAGFSLQRLNTIDAAFKAQNRLVSERLEPLYVAREALAQSGLAARNAYIFADDLAAERELGLLDQERRRFLEALDKLQPVMGDNYAFEKVRQGLLSMARALERPRRYRISGEMSSYGRFLVEECSPLRRQIVADIAEVLRVEEQRAEEARIAANLVAHNARFWILLLSCIELGVGAMIAYLMSSKLLYELGGEPRYATEISGRIAQGDLAVCVATKAGDKHSLMASMTVMRDSLANIVSQVRAGTTAIEHTSDEIAHGNLDLSERTALQAKQLEQIAQAMEVLTATVKENAANAREASTLSNAASAVSERGGNVVQQVVQTMTSIEASSRQIVDIISVIDGLAFQTNILALNAAVEAALAGEQGRGFAVVATEVRNLAQRSALAAQEIKALITATVSQVDAGSELVRQAGQTMQDVVISIRGATELMQGISDASEIQSVGIERIGLALGELDVMTQQNAALVEEAAGAAHAMHEYAENLSQVVDTFKLPPESMLISVYPMARRSREMLTLAAPKQQRVRA